MALISRLTSSGVCPGTRRQSRATSADEGITLTLLPASSMVAEMVLVVNALRKFRPGPFIRLMASEINPGD